MKLIVLHAIANDEQQEREDGPRGGDPGRRNFFKGKHGDENGAEPGFQRGEQARVNGASRSAEVGAEVEQRGHEREGEEAQGEVVPLARCVDVEKQRAGRAGEDEEAGLKAEIAAPAIVAEDSEKEREGSPRNGDPEAIALAVGEQYEEGGRGGGVEIRGIDRGIRRFIEAEPARAEIEERDNESERDETG